MKYFLAFGSLFLLSLVSFSQSVHYVDPTASGSANGTSWTNAFTSLDSAFAHYSNGDSIWMVKGTYKPANSGTNSYINLPNGVKIYGGFAGTESSIDQRDLSKNKSYFDGDIGTNGSSTDNARKVLYVANNTSQVVVDGFVIRNGYAYTIGGSITVGGGGARVLDGKVRFENCEFSDNYTYMRGGALAIYGSSSRVELVNCLFKDNLSRASTSSGLGGAIFCNAGILRITDCDFRSNSARQGGAIATWQPTVYIDRTTFSGNEAARERGGAIDNGSESSLNIYNSLFVGNYAETTGAAIYTSTSLNTEIQRYINCTFAHNYNKSTGTSYAVYTSDKTTVANCIVYGNKAKKQMFNLPPAISPTIRNCILGDDTITNGTSVYYSDPLFVKPGTASSAAFELGTYDYSLKLKSEGVNNGSNSDVHGSYAKDLHSNSRIFGKTVDIGAIESPYVSFLIQASLADKNSGSISGGGQYQKDSTVTLSTSPSSSCYTFLHWKEKDSIFSTDTMISFKASADRSFVAHYQQGIVKVSTSSDPSLGGSTSGSGTFNCSKDSSKTFIATAQPCYNFVAWTHKGDTLSKNDTISMFVVEDMDLVAHFSDAFYDIIATPTSASGGQVVGSGRYKCDSMVFLEAKANACYKFINWTESDKIIGTDTALSFKATGNRSIQANFELLAYTVNVVVDPVVGGSVSGDGKHNCGSEVTLIATRNQNYIFTGWEEGGKIFSTNPSYQFTIDKDRNFKATFDKSSSIDDIKGPRIKIYPNPFNSSLNIKTASSHIGLEYSLVDALGQEVDHGTISTTELSINTSMLDDGVYWLNIGESTRLVVKL